MVSPSNIENFRFSRDFRGFREIFENFENHIVCIITIRYLRPRDITDSVVHQFITMTEREDKR